MGEGDDDPDREAILARRRKLIAVALAGLTSAAGCGDDAAPQPCLQYADPQGTSLTPVEEEKDEGAGEGEGEDEDETAGTTDMQGGETTESPDVAPPRVCLRRAPVKRRPPPMPCLQPGMSDPIPGIDDDDV